VIGLRSYNKSGIRVRCFYFILLICWGLPGLWASVYSQYIFNRFTEENGLSSNRTFCSLKDKDGFIWIGTVDGLYRFDGTDVLKIHNRMNDSTVLSENTIRSLCQDRFGMIWAGSENSGVIILNPQTLNTTRFSTNPYDSLSISADESKDIFEDKTGNLWFAVKDEGIDKYIRDKQIFINYKPTQQYSKLSSRLANSILCHALDPVDDHILWFGSLLGIFRFDTKKEEWTHFPVSRELAENPDNYGGRESVVRTMVFDQEGTIWFGTWGGGLCRLDPKSGYFKIYKYEDLNPVNGYRNNIRRILWKNDHELWFCAQHKGFGYFNTKTGAFTFLKNPGSNKISVPDPFDFFIDQDGLIGIASYASGYYSTNINAHQFNRTEVPYSLIAIEKSDDPDRFWASGHGVYGKLLNIDKKTGNYIEHAFHPVNDRAENFFINIFNDENRLWLPEHFNLYYFDKSVKKIFPYNGFNPESLMIDKAHLHNFTSSSFDGENVWMGTKFQGLFRIDIKKKICQNYIYLDTIERNPFFQEFIFTLNTDNKGRTWFGSRNFGYFDRKINEFTKFVFPENFKECDIKLRQIYSFTETPNGNIWLGTQHSGIAVLEEEGSKYRFIKSYSGKNGLQDNKILKMITDNTGRIWALTETGLSRIDPEKDHIENYSSAYGLIDLRCIHLEENGEILVGSRNGFYIFHPEEIEPVNFKIKPYVKSIKIFDKPIEFQSLLNEKNRIELKHNQNFFAIEYGAINYFEPQKNNFSVYLEGLDQAWHYAGKRKYISYTNLEGGNYIFRLKVNDGQELAIPIFISTPFWKTAWFFALIGLSILGIVLMIHFYRMKQMRKQEALKSIYNKKISQLEIKALRSQMNPHFLFNSLNSIRFYILKNENDNASEYITKFSRLLRLILRNSRQNQISLKDEIQALNIYIDFEQMRFSKKFDYQVTVDETIRQEEVKIQPMTLQPFVENAIWHGLMPKKGSGKLDIQLTKNGNALEIIIEDNGIGRKKAASLKKNDLLETKSFGLQITEDRMNLMQNIRGKKSDFRIVDLYDQENNPCGTKVVITYEI